MKIATYINDRPRAGLAFRLKPVDARHIRKKVGTILSAIGRFLRALDKRITENLDYRAHQMLRRDTGRVLKKRKR